MPAVNEINEHGDEGGFFVAYEGMREGKSFTKIKFTLSKTAARDDRDEVLQGKAKRARRSSVRPTAAPGAAYEPTDAVLDQLRDDRAGLGPASAARALSRVEQGQDSRRKSARRVFRMGQAFHEGKGGGMREGRGSIQRHARTSVCVKSLPLKSNGKFMFLASEQRARQGWKPEGGNEKETPSQSRYAIASAEGTTLIRRALWQNRKSLKFSKHCSTPGMTLLPEPSRIRS